MLLGLFGNHSACHLDGISTWTCAGPCHPLAQWLDTSLRCQLWVPRSTNGSVVVPWLKEDVWPGRQRVCQCVIERYFGRGLGRCIKDSMHGKAEGELRRVFQVCSGYFFSMTQIVIFLHDCIEFLKATFPAQRGLQRGVSQLVTLTPIDNYLIIVCMLVASCGFGFTDSRFLFDRCLLLCTLQHEQERLSTAHTDPSMLLSLVVTTHGKSSCSQLRSHSCMNPKVTWLFHESHLVLLEE